MKLLLSSRKARRYGNFSIESYFNGLSVFFNKKGEVNHWKSPLISNGFFPRIWSIIALARTVLKYKPNVTHVTGDVHFLMWGIPIGKRVLTIHDVGFLRGATGLRYRILRYFWLTGPVKRADVVTCVSSSTKMEILYHLKKPCPINVIPTSIDPRFKPRIKQFNNKRPTILMLGSAPNKNVHRVLSATKHLNVKLSIVAELDEAAMKLLDGQTFEICSSISFEELLEKYHEADILAMCSTHEGFGMPIIEAQATGTVVLTSDCSSMPEIGGNGAYYIDPMSVNSIRKGIENLCNDSNLREQLIVNGYENSRRFSAEIVAEQYLALYSRLMD